VQAELRADRLAIERALGELAEQADLDGRQQRPRGPEAEADLKELVGGDRGHRASGLDLSHGVASCVAKRNGLPPRGNLPALRAVRMAVQRGREVRDGDARPNIRTDAGAAGLLSQDVPECLVPAAAASPRLPGARIATIRPGPLAAATARP
jgi:hypothetical protein